MPETRGFCKEGTGPDGGQRLRKGESQTLQEEGGLA